MTASLTLFALLQTSALRERVVAVSLEGARYRSARGWVPWGIIVEGVEWDDSEGQLVLQCEQVALSLSVSSFLPWATVTWPSINCHQGVYVSGNETVATLMLVTMRGFLVNADGATPTGAGAGARTLLQAVDARTEEDRGLATLFEKLFVWKPVRDFTIQSFQANRLVLRSDRHSPIGTQIDVIGKAHGSMDGLLDAEVTVGVSTGAHSGIGRLLRKPGEEAITATFSWTKSQTLLGRISVQGALRAERAPYGCRSSALMDLSASAVIGRVHTQGWDAQARAHGTLSCDGISTVTAFAGNMVQLNASFERAVEFRWFELITDEGTLSCAKGECSGVAAGQYSLAPPRFLHLCSGEVCADVREDEGLCRAALLLANSEVWVWRGSLVPFYTVSNKNEAHESMRATGVIRNWAVQDLALSASYPKLCFVAAQLGPLLQLSGCAQIDFLAANASLEFVSSTAAASIGFQWGSFGDDNVQICALSNWGHFLWETDMLRVESGRACGSVPYGLQSAKVMLLRDENKHSTRFLWGSLYGGSAFAAQMFPAPLGLVRTMLERLAPERHLPTYIDGFVERFGLQTNLGLSVEYTPGMALGAFAKLEGSLVDGEIRTLCLEREGGVLDCQLSSQIREEPYVYSVNASRHFTL